MRLAVLGSGSAGNALVVESEGRRLLVDAGFAGGTIERKLRQLGEEARRLDGVLLTHEHDDHRRGADVLARRHGLPVYATAGTLAGAGLSEAAAAAARVVRSGEPFEVADWFRVEAFRLPHDAREPVGFVIEDGRGARLGLAYDLGSRSRLAWGRMRDLDALVIEANHDLQMLRAGPYPWHLKQRVASRHGHLSNRDAARGVAELACDRLRLVVLYHLSRTNNEPALAAQAVGAELDACGAGVELVVTRQDCSTPWIELEPHGQLSLAL
jgi:phosphoribosyl 1,2-cyclic phosphodiesterase